MSIDSSDLRLLSLLDSTSTPLTTHSIPSYTLHLALHSSDLSSVEDLNCSPASTWNLISSSSSSSSSASSSSDELSEQASLDLDQWTETSSLLDSDLNSVFPSFEAPIVSLGLLDAPTTITCSKSEANNFDAAVPSLMEAAADKTPRRLTQEHEREPESEQEHEQHEHEQEHEHECEQEQDQDQDQERDSDGASELDGEPEQEPEQGPTQLLDTQSHGCLAEKPEFKETKRKQRSIAQQPYPVPSQRAKPQVACLQSKEFGCDICHKRFGNKFNLDRHIKTLHGGAREFYCENCEHWFTQRASLKRHWAQFHPHIPITSSHLNRISPKSEDGGDLALSPVPSASASPQPQFSN